MTYAEWIEDYKTRIGDAILGTCQKAVDEMAAVFPELTKVSGHVYCPHPWGKRAHWWCTDPDGNIVDPTASQFPGIFEYEPWVPGTEVRVGKCMNCGEDIWQAVESLEEAEKVSGQCICSDACEREYRAYLNNPGY
jgi:hypothetical protein